MPQTPQVPQNFIQNSGLGPIHGEWLYNFLSRYPHISHVECVSVGDSYEVRCHLNSLQSGMRTITDLNIAFGRFPGFDRSLIDSPPYIFEAQSIGESMVRICRTEPASTRQGDNVVQPQRSNRRGAASSRILYRSPRSPFTARLIMRNEQGRADEGAALRQSVARESAAVHVEHGKEFETLGNLLQHNPAARIDSIIYEKNGDEQSGIDLGALLRQCFTQAHEQSLKCLKMQEVALLGASKDFDGSLKIETIDEIAVEFDHFGRLLACVADQKNVNLAVCLFDQSVDAILTLANFIDDLNIQGKNKPSDLLQSAQQVLDKNKKIISQLVDMLLPNVSNSLKKDLGNPLALYSDPTQSVPEEVREILSEYLSDHFEQALGIRYSKENDRWVIPSDSSRFVQLALIAGGFDAVRKARTSELGSNYPVDVKAVAASIKGNHEDIRRALSDPNDIKAFTLRDSTESLSQTELDTLKRLIHQWAADASDQQLSMVCRTLTGSDVLPDSVGNSDNKILINIIELSVRGMPVDFKIHGCFGMFDISPYVVKEILAEHQENPHQQSARLDRLLGHDVPSESQFFNMG
jgi:hypothetical protein